MSRILLTTKQLHLTQWNYYMFKTTDKIDTGAQH